MINIYIYRLYVIGLYTFILLYFVNILIYIAFYYSYSKLIKILGRFNQIKFKVHYRTILN